MWLSEVDFHISAGWPIEWPPFKYGARSSWRIATSEAEQRELTRTGG